MESRGDNVSGLNLRRSLDKSCHRLQHLRINIGVVSFGIGFVFPQTDCSHINFAGTSECDFVLKVILLTKQREEEIVLSLGGLLLPRSLNGKLKSKDFFNADQDPLITFLSKKIVQTGPTTFDVQGDFTIRGATKPQTLTLTVSGAGTGSGEIHGTMVFDRKDYGMNKGIPFVRIGDSVDVTVDLKAKRISGPPVVLKQ
jgi:YceI-like domain